MWWSGIITFCHIEFFSPFCVGALNSAVAQNGAARKRPSHFLLDVSHDPGCFLCLSAAAQVSNRWQGERRRGKVLTKTSPSPLWSLKRDVLLKKLSSSHPGLPLSCLASCRAQKLKSRTRRWTSVRGERPRAAAWRSKGSEAAGHPAEATAGCPPAKAATDRTSLLIGSWEECCC